MRDSMIDGPGLERRACNVRVGIGEDAFVHLMPALLDHVHDAFETLELDIVCQLSHHLQQQMREGTLDLALVALPENVPSAAHFGRSRLQWVAWSGFMFDERVPLPLACYPEGNFFRAISFAALDSRGITYRELLRSRSTEVIMSAVRAGMAITVMAEGTAPKDLEVVTPSCSALPPLGTVGIQLMQKPVLLSRAGILAKIAIGNVFHGA